MLIQILRENLTHNTGVRKTNQARYAKKRVGHSISIQERGGVGRRRRIGVREGCHVSCRISMGVLGSSQPTPQQYPSLQRESLEYPKLSTYINSMQEKENVIFQDVAHNHEVKLRALLGGLCLMHSV